MNQDIIAEYIWIDAYNNLRSKARTISIDNIPEWNYDGSSTGQATNQDSEVVIIPRATFNDPFRTGNNILVLCDCYNKEMETISTNTRYNADKIFDQVLDHHIWFGIEQEYVMIDNKTDRLLGWPTPGYGLGVNKDEPEPQGKYYCGIGSGKVFGRHIVDEHYELCLYAGIKISGINAEVLPGQWEFQVGPCEGIDAADQLWMARYILERVAEKYDVRISYKPKPIIGDWNGSGCHINCSTIAMRTQDIENNGLNHIFNAIEKLSKKHKEHLLVYGDNTIRLSGHHETSSKDTFTYGVASRGTSIRIPSTTFKNGYGYFEDRRPASDIDPYLATSILAETILL